MLKANHYLAAIGYTPATCVLLDEDNTKNDPKYQPDAEGFIPAEFWSFDRTLTLMLYSNLSYFREYCASGGYPTGTESEEEWQTILDKMIKGFAAKIYLQDHHWSLTKEEQENLEAQFQKSMTLLIKFWDALWS